MSEVKTNFAATNESSLERITFQFQKKKQIQLCILKLKFRIGVRLQIG
ncbi:hypothetical protein LEP1GSC192_1638 [Leptospira sp. B5-022]|nr:hypothetical protein LEP1GSC192_1638 [Leptospira sp. B5-022]